MVYALEPFLFSQKMPDYGSQIVVGHIFYSFFPKADEFARQKRLYADKFARPQ